VVAALVVVAELVRAALDLGARAWGSAHEVTMEAILVVVAGLVKVDPASEPPVAVLTIPRPILFIALRLSPLAFQVLAPSPPIMLPVMLSLFSRFVGTTPLFSPDAVVDDSLLATRSKSVVGQQPKYRSMNARYLRPGEPGAVDGLARGAGARGAGESVQGRWLGTGSEAGVGAGVAFGGGSGTFFVGSAVSGAFHPFSAPP